MPDLPTTRKGGTTLEEVALERAGRLREMAKQVEDVRWSTPAVLRENASLILTLAAENERLREALERVSSMPTLEFNPDGDEQAAWSMQAVARDALATHSDGEQPSE